MTRQHERTADCVVAGYRVHRAVPGAIGSLMLGLYADDAALMPVGVVGAFPMVRRRELFVELQPLVTDVSDHPWRSVAEEAAGRMRRGEGSRWNPSKDLSFVPLRPERVVEVGYDYMEGIRFRHPARFMRWRPDRDPASCGYSQLARPVRLDLAKVLAGRVT
jgi:ATP-dependent DNA ligase